MTAIYPLPVGPIVGHADTSHVRIFGRAQLERTASGRPHRAFGIARLKKQADTEYTAPQFFKMNPNVDLTGIAIFTQLQPDTAYDYQVGYFLTDAKKPDEDKWSGFTKPRDLIIDKVRQLSLHKVVFLSGDLHCSVAAELEIGDVPSNSQKIYSVISSSFSGLICICMNMN